MDSRSLSFVDEVRDRTRGEGVDVVLNALAGDFIPASLGLLRPFGRFLEIGKRDGCCRETDGLYHAASIWCQWKRLVNPHRIL